MILRRILSDTFWRSFSNCSRSPRPVSIFRMYSYPPRLNIHLMYPSCPGSMPRTSLISGVRDSSVAAELLESASLNSSQLEAMAGNA